MAAESVFLFSLKSTVAIAHVQIDHNNIQSNKFDEC